MDIVVIYNGLGNQMSQYAFYMAKRKHAKHCTYIFHNVSSGYHNGSELDKVFGIKYKNSLVNRIFKKIYTISDGIPKLRKYLHLFGIKVIREPKNYDYTPDLLLAGPTAALNFYTGGWHCEKYGSTIADEIRKTFTFKIDKEREDKHFNDALTAIRNNPNSISLHVRRGDYLNVAENSYYRFDGIATVEYYQKAMTKIEQKIEQPTYYVFSDDLSWCKTFLSAPNIVFIDCNKGEKSWRDMFLMSQCRHHIIANSTFSWWGAWLCPHQNSITICPKEFIREVAIKDVYPEKWIKISGCKQAEFQ